MDVARLDLDREKNVPANVEGKVINEDVSGTPYLRYYQMKEKDNYFKINIIKCLEEFDLNTFRIKL